MPGDHLAGHTQPRGNKAVLAVAVGGLVQVHVIHVDLVPGNIAAELSVPVQIRLLQLAKPTDPHFGGAEGMHPCNDARAARIGVGGENNVGNGLAVQHRALEHDVADDGSILI